MNFSVERVNENDLFLLRLKDASLQTSVDIVPGYGALLNAFRVNVGGEIINIVNGYPGKKAVDELLDRSYKGSKLSPFPCRIAGGVYEWGGQQFEFAKKFIDGSAIHGLLFDKPFRSTGEFRDDDKAAIRLKYHYKREDPGYPYDYVCEVEYALHPNNLVRVETTVINLDDLPIPIADGWHPYFTLGDNIDNCTLQIASQTMLEFDDHLVPTGNLLNNPTFEKGCSLGGQNLDNCFVVTPDEQYPICQLYNPHNQLRLLFFTNSNYPYLQIYTPPDRASIAIENLSAAPDCFNNGMGLKLILPRRSETFTVWYKVHAGQIQ